MQRLCGGRGAVRAGGLTPVLDYSAERRCGMPSAGRAYPEAGGQLLLAEAPVLRVHSFAAVAAALVSSAPERNPAAAAAAVA